MPEDDPIDLSGLDLAPDWVKEIQKPPREIPDHQSERQGPRGPKGPRRDKRGPRRDERGPRKDGPGGGRPGSGGSRRDGAGPKGRGPRGRDGGGGPGKGRGPRDREERQRPKPPPIEGFKVILQPLDPGIQYLVQQIRMTGRAYPLFDLAKLLLDSQERYKVTLRRENEGSPDLFRCPADGSLWLSRDEAMRHILNSDAIGAYYDVETVEGDPPKGNFTTIAICGLSGKLLGPPNYHGYQPALSRLYRQRFSHMDFARFKSRIKMSHDEETIEKWKEEEGTRTIYRAKGEEAVELKDFTALEQHFRQHHAEAVQSVEEATIPGNAGSKKLASGPLNGLIRDECERQKRFPLEVMQFLCRKFEEAGLKFFKKGKKRTFVTLSRPRPVPADVTLSDGINRILDFVRLNPGTNLNQLASMLLPKEERSRPAGKKEAHGESLPVDSENPPSTPDVKSGGEESSDEAPKAAAERKGEMETAALATDTAGQEAPADAKGKTDAPAAREEEAKAPRESPTGEEPRREPGAKAPSALTHSEIAILQDLRWLVREGFVIEYNDGKLFLSPERQETPPRKRKKKAPATAVGARKKEGGRQERNPAVESAKPDSSSADGGDAPARGESPPPAGTPAPSPARGESPPPAEEPGPSPARGESPPPAEEPAPSPARGESPPPAEEPGPSPARGESPPPAEEPAPSPAQGESPPPAGTPAPSPARGESPPPAEEPGPSPARGESPPPAEEPAPSPARGESPPPAEEPGPSPARGESPPPAEEPAPSPARGESPPPAEEPGPSPARGESPPPAEEPGPSPARGESPPPAEEPGPSPARGESPPPAGKPAPESHVTGENHEDVAGKDSTPSEAGETDGSTLAEASDSIQAR